MDFEDRSIVVTGAGRGIGRALVHAFARRGGRVCVVDVDSAAAERVAAEVGGVAVTCDVADPEAIIAMIERATASHGPVEILVSNAGFAAGALSGPTLADDALWQRNWDVHVMAHLRAARAVLPEMQRRGEGWLVNVASAAGLLSQIGDAPYSASKHAAVSLAQSLAIEHGHEGIRASVVCPLYVATPLLGYDDDHPEGRPHERVLTAEDVAGAVLQGMDEDRFLILPHPEAGEFLRRRAEDMDRWISGMQRVRDRVWDDGTPVDLGALHRLI
ncbi:SDR family oxidoreductase [Cognatishimia sp. F0-27]|uniref:SDR family NAD(P)-dependent oxidoreductase n=1 Tax=Cognatishimia sp. F0-27 TaxID=2816855 RepID=UPI001D0C0949|nr:SDR family oxidoreductase [Cognatishimia sp. F0-27]MCC1492471.1 SDR family oxidoreductase [Cognatishimia sp. F0-27]